MLEFVKKNSFDGNLTKVKPTRSVVFTDITSVGFRVENDSGAVLLRRGRPDQRHHPPLREAVQRQPHSAGQPY